MLTERAITIRLADSGDRHALQWLLRNQDRVHSHLDWKPVEEWLGKQPFLFAEEGRRVVGALACPPDPPDTAWLRLLCLVHDIPALELWRLLWPRARQMLVERGVNEMAAISIDGWIDGLCLESGFEQTHAVVVLSRPRHAPIVELPSSPAATVRLARPADFETIKSVDTAAFAPPWQMSYELLDLAIERSDLLTVAEVDGQIVGYQLTTPSHLSAHLARLAVLPACQRQGIGAALLQHLIGHYNRLWIREVTVNTQDTNAASLRLYQRFGFRLTGTRYPVFQCPLA